MSLEVVIVPHTHWDREWYEPFQTFRMRLVEVLDQVLSLLETDPSYSCFLLDGQMAAAADYLEVRPDAEDRLRYLVSAGRLSVGPWYVLMDELLVSGETIVRDLQLGMKRAAAFGGAMQVGYLPDMFGHIAQMPQVLRMAGFDHAVVWRGVPSGISKSAFWWEAPDGSRVRAEYLVTGYSNGQSLPRDAKDLVRRVRAQAAEVAGFTLGSLLYMNGTDHQAPQPWLGRLLDEANEIQDEIHFEVTSLPAYLASAPADDLPTWSGELRSGARANLLMGVASNRVDVKKAAAITERAIERRAEPYGALFLPPRDWPERLLDLAWLRMIQNAAHDSICACSVDEVVDSVLHRFAEARQIAEGVTERALSALSASLAEGGPTVVNPSHRPRSGVVEMVLGAGALPPDAPVQVISERSGTPGVLTLDASTVRNVLGTLQGTQVDSETWVQEVRVAEDESGIDITVVMGHEERHDVPVDAIKRDIAARLDARPDAVVRVRIDQPASRRVLALVQGVRGYGWQAIRPVAPEHPVRVEDGPLLANGLVALAVDSSDGTFSLDGIPGYGRLVDGGDHGDSYNYSPPENDTLVDMPEDVTVEVLEHGPLRAAVAIRARYRWPERVDASTQGRAGEATVEVTTTLELRADERFVRVATAFVNPCRDHRVRVHLPLRQPAAHSEAECAFAVVTRGLEAEGRPEELGLPTFPSRRFVSAGGLHVAHEGLHEYELVDIEPGPSGPTARTLALTLLRSTGMLSRLGMTYRPLPAGPLTPVEGLQMVGRRIEARYALCTSSDGGGGGAGGSYRPYDPYELVDDAFLPLEVVYAPGGGGRPPEGSGLVVEGAEVSALRRVDGALEVRVFNPRSGSATVRVGEERAWLVDLRGRPLGAVEGGFELRPYGIATVRIPSRAAIEGQC